MPPPPRDFGLRRIELDDAATNRTVVLVVIIEGLIKIIDDPSTALLVVVVLLAFYASSAPSTARGRYLYGPRLLLAVLDAARVRARFSAHRLFCIMRFACRLGCPRALAMRRRRRLAIRRTCCRLGQPAGRRGTAFYALICSALRPTFGHTRNSFLGRGLLAFSLTSSWGEDRRLLPSR